MHAVYWIVTHPVNRFWLEEVDLKGLGARFFGRGRARGRSPEGRDDSELWTRLRDRWEYSHVARAVLSAAALLALLLDIAT